MERKILIVDDEYEVRESLAKALKKQGFICHKASSAQEARACLKTQDFDLLICDILMPGESGLNVVKLADSSYPDMAVIIITGVDDPDLAADAFEMGVYGYLIKPFELKQLLITVQNALRRHELEKKEKASRQQLEKMVQERTIELEQNMQCLMETQEALKENEEKFRTVVESSNDGMTIIDGEKFLYVNPKWLEIYGFTKAEEVIGKSIGITIHPDDRELVSSRASMINVKDDIPDRDRFRGIRTDGKTIYLEVSATTTTYKGKKAILSILRDITEDVASEEALKESEEKFRAISETAHEAIIIIDGDMIITYWNIASERTFGFNADEAIGQKITDIIVPKRFHDFYIEAFKKFKETGKLSVKKLTVERIALKKGGEEFPIEVSLSTAIIKRIPHVIWIVRDLTERKRTEDALLKKTEELNNMMHILEGKNIELQNANKELKRTQGQIIQQEKMASIGQLAAGVAHEINNPTGFIGSNLGTFSGYQEDLFKILSAYRSLSSRLEKGSIAPDDLSNEISEIRALESEFDIDFIMEDLPGLIGESIEGTERIKKIVMDLKDFAHPGNKELSYADINKSIDSTLNIVWNELKYKALVQKEYGDIPEVLCHPQEINQVFMNLLVNAAQAIEEHGEIIIKTTANNGGVRIQITDSGKGIAEEDLPRIFDPFFTTKEIGKGTGLGLHLVYNIINKHKGKIHVASNIGEGTTFTIDIPTNTH